MLIDNYKISIFCGSPSHIRPNFFNVKINCGAEIYALYTKNIPYWKLSEYYNELVNLLRFTKIILKSMPKYVEVAVNFPRKPDEMKIHCR